MKANGVSATAQCPAHDDRDPSLSVRKIEESVLLHCHAGCQADDVLTALRLTARDLYDEPRGATYHYDDGRLVHRSPEKQFRQSGNTKGGALYRRSKVTAAVAAGQTIYVLEGEKDVHALEGVGAVACCSPMGASNAHKADWTPLHGAHVVVVPDRDDAGQRYASDVLAALDGKTESIRVALPAVGKDAADHIAAGHGLDELVPVETPAVDAEATAMEQAAEFARAVECQAYDLRVREAARLKVAAERAGETPPFDAGLLTEVLARPAEPPYRVEGLIPSEGGTLVVAQRKTGKTTLELNLARTLILGGHFLARFAVRPIAGRVALLNYEVSAAQLARWADEVGIPRDRLFVVNLRGRRNALGHEDDRALLAEQLRAHEVETLIVDPTYVSLGRDIC